MELGTGPSAHDSLLLSVHEDLLAALGRRLDIRDLFRHLSTIATRIVPHDEADLVLPTEDASAFRLYAIPADGVAGGMPATAAATILEGSEPQLLDVVPGPDRGLHSGLKVPVRIDGRVVGAFALFSRRPQAYSTSDLGHAERFASYLALALSNEQMVGQACDAAVERERAASFELPIELLRTIAGVLDIRTVLSRVSEIANKVLPHDALTMSRVEENRTFVGDGLSSADFPLPPLVTVGTPLPDELIVDDFACEPLPFDPSRDLNERLIAAGFRAVLYVIVPARGRTEGVGFWSKHPGAFQRRDLPMARRIAELVALAVSHEHLADAERQIAAARARAEQLEARVQVLAQELESKSHIRVVGESAEWRDVLKKAAQVAKTETTALLTGESGTGKEVIARFIHRASARSQGPFVALNCAALPEQLLESELFGYERGAFTSAQQAKPGQIEIAAGGVLFLDEVSEMSLSAQAKFLRVLQEREFQRLGATKVLKANIRVIAATNRDLCKAVERGDFREDLFYRLQVFDIHVPPLRERRSDILPLSEAFLREIGEEFGRPPVGMTRDARDALLRYHWPGNVRELRNALERAVILCDGELIQEEHLALEAPGRPRGAGSNDLRSVERETIAQVLRECRWNKARAARRLGLTRTQLYGRMRKLGLEEPSSA